jgi:hypothetical protein
MTYNVFTTANKSYFPFVDVLVQSLTQNCENLDRIYIADCGLGEYRNYLQDKPNVSIIDTNIVDEYAGVHSEGWVKATQQKTRILYKLLTMMDIEDPLIMIDSDVCVLKDFESVIDMDYDIQVTTMHTGGHTRADGIFIKEIASFLVINDWDIGKSFVYKWIKQMEEFGKNGTPFPHETPALNMTLQNSTDLKIGYLKELEVCADQEMVDETLSVHFKSNGSTTDNPVVNFENRVMSPNNRTNIDLDVDKYLEEKIYEQWRSEYETT